MRILFISASKVNEDRIRSELRDLCEGYSLRFCYDFQEAKDYINNNIVKFQIPLDLIITNSTVAMRKAEEIRNFIRFDDKRTYSKRDFNLNQIPIAVIVESELNKSAFHDYDAVIDDLGVDKLHLFVSDFISAIKGWRKQVLDDLDAIGIRFNSGIIDYTHYILDRKTRRRPTKILSENFKLFPRKLNYYWLDYDKRSIEIAIDKFVKMLKHSRSVGKKGEEKKYHDFFNQNESFLLRDAYSRFWYEAKLMKNDTKYEEPDYTLKPNMTYETDLSLLEVKLPNEAFMTKKKYHKTPRAKLIQHIIQVNDYKEYLDSDEYLSEINNVFGYIPKRINYSILIGRNESKQEHIQDLNKTMRQLGQGELQLMTYDDLMEYQVKFLDRMELINIKN